MRYACGLALRICFAAGAQFMRMRNYGYMSLVPIPYLSDQGQASSTHSMTWHIRGGELDQRDRWTKKQR